MKNKSDPALLRPSNLSNDIYPILMTFSCLNFKTLCLCGKDPSESGILDLLPSGGFFVRGLSSLALHGINSDSAGNYQLIDEESTGRISSKDCQHSPSTG
jgi:hypothetical protein